MNGLLSKIWGGGSNSQDQVEEPGRREDASLLRDGTRVVDTNYRDCGVSSRSGGSWWDKAKSWLTWDASSKYGQIAASDLEASSAKGKSNNSCGVFPSTKLEEVAEVSAACSSGVKRITEAHTSSTHSSRQRCYGGPSR